jgi:hypothetical protein
MKSQIKRWTVVVCVLALLMTTGQNRAIYAQENTNVQDGTAVTPLGDAMNANEANAPVAGEIADAQLASDEDFQNKIAFVNSLTEEQRTAFTNILSQHQPEQEAIAKELQTAQVNVGDNQVFLPSIVGGDEQTNATAQQAERVNAKIAQATTKMESIQSTINQELGALLTVEQKELFEKTGFAQVSDGVSASAVDAVSEPQSATNCYYGAYYGSLAAYYSRYAEYYAYFDYVYVDNSYSYNSWYYNYYGKARAYSGTLYAGGAYARSFVENPGSWNDTAYTEFGTARTNSYWGRYYAYRSWRAGSNTYGYYAYVNADKAYYYEYYARSNSYYCSH